MKSQDIMDVTPDEVIKSLEKHQCQLMNHGHPHRPAKHQISANGQSSQRIVLGDWYEQGAWLKAFDGKLELLNQPLISKMLPNKSKVLAPIDTIQKQ